MAEFTKCGVCLGEPLPSGKPCICGGIGTEQAEMHGLRSALFDADNEIARLRAENERLRAVAAQVLTHYSASLDYQPPYVRMAREALEAIDGS